MPTEVPGVDAALLDPRGTWDDPAAYDEAAADLAGKIQEHAAEMGLASGARRSGTPRAVRDQG